MDANTSNLANVALTYTPVIPRISANTDMSSLRLNASHAPSPTNIIKIEKSTK